MNVSKNVLIVLFLLVVMNSYGSVRLTLHAAVVDAESEIPDSLFDNVNIDSLTITNCHITIVPSQIRKFKNLKYLNFQGSHFDSVSVESFNQLEDLNLSLTHIKEVPHGLCSLKKLRVLNLSKTFITKIPNEIGDLTNLEVLKLNNTFVKELPVSMGRLTNLHEFWVINTKVSHIPVELTKIKSLRYVWIYWTNIDNANQAVKLFRANNPGIFFGYSSND